MILIAATEPESLPCYPQEIPGQARDEGIKPGMRECVPPKQSCHPAGVHYSTEYNGGSHPRLCSIALTGLYNFPFSIAFGDYRHDSA